MQPLECDRDGGQAQLTLTLSQESCGIPLRHESGSDASAHGHAQGLTLEVTPLLEAFSRDRVENRNDFSFKSTLLHGLAPLTGDGMLMFLLLGNISLAVLDIFWITDFFRNFMGEKKNKTQNSEPLYQKVT